MDILLTYKKYVSGCPQATGMSTLEVEIPAGYSVDEAQVKEENDNANLVEFDHKDKLVLYYNGDVVCNIV